MEGNCKQKLPSGAFLCDRQGKAMIAAPLHKKRWGLVLDCRQIPTDLTTEMRGVTPVTTGANFDQLIKRGFSGNRFSVGP